MKTVFRPSWAGKANCVWCLAQRGLPSVVASPVSRAGAPEVRTEVQPITVSPLTPAMPWYL